VKGRRAPDHTACSTTFESLEPPVGLADGRI
jgi:hypothetical protein